MQAKNPLSDKEVLPHLFRQEYTKMTAVLCRHFGFDHMEMAEDIASETFLKASEHWAINGIPDNPTAWLYTVAKNKAKDLFKRQHTFKTRIKNGLSADELQEAYDFDFDDRNLADSQLSMFFLVCNPKLSTPAQISVVLQLLCGFSVEEIANAFLEKPETVKKRLLRARSFLRKDNFQTRIPNKTEIGSRLDTVLKILYLMFNEGYFSKSHNQLIIRKDLCSEALRLTLILTQNPLTSIPQAHALLALMCFQSSRLEARTNDQGESVLFEEQDRDLWDKALIDRGNYYLINACNGNEISKYHLEAAIAYWHTTSIVKQKWLHILQLYNQLILIEYSPITALNRAFAFSKVYGKGRAILEVQKLNLTTNSHYHELLGYLNADTNPAEAIYHYEMAITFIKSSGQKLILLKAIKRIKEAIPNHIVR
jgi:RNA polymerase sigma factor (sigma-70 family)